MLKNIDVGLGMAEDRPISNVSPVKLIQFIPIQDC